MVFGSGALKPHQNYFNNSPMAPLATNQELRAEHLAQKKIWDSIL